MSDYEERTRDEIVLTSPRGTVFNALWAGNKKQIKKKLGIFEFPLVNGAVVQDLSTASTLYPITFYFDGPDNDLLSNNFVVTWSNERGPWSVNHPAEGLLNLQPISINPNTDPVNSGGITVIDSEWIEPTSGAEAQSVTELEAAIDASRADLNIASAEAAERSIPQDSTAEKLEIKAAAEASNNSIITNLADIYNQSADVAADVGATLTAIQDTINQAAIDTLVLAGQINNAIQAPARAVNDFTSRLTAYASMVGDFFSHTSGGVLQEDRSNIATIETYLNATIGAVGIIATTSEFTTRPEIIQAITDIESLYNQIINGLESLQDNFKTLPVDKQYFTFLETYGNISIYFSEIIAFLLRTSLSLKIEKRFKLDQSRTPWEIALTEYGGPGDSDSNLDLFILSNGLKGNDILLLPPGREVVVYV